MEENRVKNILQYVQEVYTPLSIIVYGSYADGSQNQNSDFDALVVSEKHEKFHDVSCVNGVQLDVFVYPQKYIQESNDIKEFVQIADGKIVFDTNEYGAILKKQASEYMKALSGKTLEELHAEVEWCKKMVLRTERKDAEGMFRWHWVLTDSLEIYCDLKQHQYKGPKKSLLWMEKYDPKAFACYKNALFHFDHDDLKKWIDYLAKMI